MEALLKVLEVLPGWFIASIAVVFTSVINYVVYRTSTSKDIEYQKDEGKKRDNSVLELSKRTRDLEQGKVDKGEFASWRVEMRTDFQGFKEDVREDIKEFKRDISTDINNVLIAIKRNNGFE